MDGWMDGSLWHSRSVQVWLSLIRNLLDIWNSNQVRRGVIQVGKICNISSHLQKAQLLSLSLFLFHWALLHLIWSNWLTLTYIREVDSLLIAFANQQHSLSPSSPYSLSSSRWECIKSIKMVPRLQWQWPVMKLRSWIFVGVRWVRHRFKDYSFLIPIISIPFLSLSRLPLSRSTCFLAFSLTTSSTLILSFTPSFPSDRTTGWKSTLLGRSRQGWKNVRCKY